jgi:hypothetical protein
MTRYLAVASAVALAGVVALAGSAARAGTLSGRAWGKAEQVPGLAALNTGGNAQLRSVSCTSAGTCTAVGYYTDSGGAQQAWVDSETHGTWGQAEQLPGLGASTSSVLNTVSCSYRGDCAAGGSYTESSGQVQAFAVTQIRGTWLTPRNIPGMATLPDYDHAGSVGFISCPAASNCTAGGTYTAKLHDHDGTFPLLFVVSQVHGIWGTAVGLSGPGEIGLAALSCGAPGNCIAGGTLSTRNTSDGWLASEVNGTWGQPGSVPGLDALNQGFAGTVNSVSCASAGNCAAVGYYTNLGDGQGVWVDSETSGTWGQAQSVIGCPTCGGTAWLRSVSCASAGNCTAGGYNNAAAVAISEVGGTWGQIETVSGFSDWPGVDLVSCGSAGNCVGASDGSVANQVYGTWRTAREVPGLAALGTGGSVTSLSCGSAGDCSAGGSYTDVAGHNQAFVVNRT